MNIIKKKNRMNNDNHHQNKKKNQNKKENQNDQEPNKYIQLASQKTQYFFVCCYFSLYHFLFFQ